MRRIYRGTGVVIGQFYYAFDFSGLHVFTDFAETVVQHFWYVFFFLGKILTVD